GQHHLHYFHLHDSRRLRGLQIAALASLQDFKIQDSPVPDSTVFTIPGRGGARRYRTARARPARNSAASRVEVKHQRPGEMQGKPASGKRLTPRPPAPHTQAWPAPAPSQPSCPSPLWNRYHDDELAALAGVGSIPRPGRPGVADERRTPPGPPRPQ